VNPISWITRRVRAVIARRAFERDLQEEMRAHLERSTERLVARGMSPADARLAARREFGNVAVLQEEARDARGARWVDALVGDVRFAFRYFARHKATTAIIVAVLVLGTGANTMIFSMFQAEFLRPAPAVPNDGALARIWVQERASRGARWQPREVSQPGLAALAARPDIFSAVAAWTSDEVVLDAGDSTGARGVNAQFVTANFFGALRVRLVAGQGLRQGAGDTPDMTAVMSYAMAEQLYGSAAAAVGRRILVNEDPVHVVGIAPPRFQGAVRHMDEPALWLPVSARADISHISPRWLTDEAALSAFARLAPDASRDQATAFVRQVVANAMPDSAARVGMARTADVLAMNALPPSEGTRDLIFGFTMISTIGILILLVAWTNVSSLMVAEERITTKFAGLVMAGESEEETTFLATQQVDEARHMQFYARFRDEVIAEPETIAAHVARSRGGSAIEVASDRGLTFGGADSVRIAPGAVVTSDPLHYAVPALGDLAITIQCGAAPASLTGHPGSRTTSYLQAGRWASAPELAEAVTTDHWYVLAGLDVVAEGAGGAVVTLGNSITDGRGSGTNRNDRWPDNLARRLLADPRTRRVAVLNAGIGGNTVLEGGLGPTALSRLERDVLAQSGARWLILLEGVNDIGGAREPGRAATVAQNLLAAYREIIARGHDRGLRVYGATIPPFGGSQYDGADREAARQRVNRWIRESGAFDAVIDFDAVLRDPAEPSRLLPLADTGDHLHPNEAGYRMMADAIDLALFIP